MDKKLCTVERCVDRVFEEKRTRRFDASDNFGRRFGAFAQCSSVTIKHEQVELYTWGVPSRAPREEGRYWTFRSHATRDGQAYGASHGEKFFKSAAERDAAVEAYFKAAEKRALGHKKRAA